MEEDEKNSNGDNDSVGKNIRKEELKLDSDDEDDNNNSRRNTRKEELKLDFDDDEDNNNSRRNTKKEELKLDFDDDEDNNNSRRNTRKEELKLDFDDDDDEETNERENKELNIENDEEKKNISDNQEEQKGENNDIDNKSKKDGVEVSKNSPSSSIKILGKNDNDTLQNISYNYLFKIALIGDASTGKTSILLRFIDDSFTEDTKSTIGVDFKYVSLELESDTYGKMQIWDTCGSERFKSLTTSFIKTCTAFILVFDLTRQSTFNNLEQWIKIINENTSPKFMILIGNKNDLVEEREVKKELVLNFCKDKYFNYMEISAKSNNNIERMFKEVAYQLFKGAQKNKNSKTVSDSGGFTNIQNQKEGEKKKGGCCS